MSVDFRNQWALVTGASSGIGEAFARALASRGANVVLVARRRERLEHLASRLATRAEVVPCDLEDPSGPRSLWQELEQQELSIDHLVNNAGFGGGGHFSEQNLDQLTGMLRLNCIALTELTRHYLPQMLERNAGGIIQVASLAGFVPTPYMAAYGATKAYVLHLASALAEEIRGSNVRMLAVCPGTVPTEFQARAGYLQVDTGATAAVSAERVAAIALAAYDRGEHVVVPGKGNALAAFFSRFGSPSLKARAAAVAMKRAGRDKIRS